MKKKKLLNKQYVRNEKMKTKQLNFFSRYLILNIFVIFQNSKIYVGARVFVAEGVTIYKDDDNISFIGRFVQFFKLRRS